jgi:hypothetical protein
MANDTNTTQDSGMWPDAAGESEPGGLIPPYEGRTKSTDDHGVTDDLRNTVERQMQDSDPGNVGATASPGDERPVRPGEVSRGASGAGTQTATDPTATTPLGVGTSTTRRGEQVKGDEGTEPGKEDLGVKGQSQRPYGKSDQRASTGVDPQDQVSGEDTFAGDMGG